MTFEDFTKHIQGAFTNQYEEQIDGDENIQLISLCSRDLPNREVFRIRRKSNKYEVDHYKTLLLLDLPNKEFLRLALEWAAAAKEYLTDPEIADLYLFIYWRGDDIPSIEDCLRIESSEEFCRKYVLQPKEKLEDFIQRTFLSTIINPNQKVLGSDPVTNAFAKLSENFDWFTKEEEEIWKKQFLSGISGSDTE